MLQPAPAGGALSRCVFQHTDILYYFKNFIGTCAQARQLLYTMTDNQSRGSPGVPRYGREDLVRPAKSQFRYGYGDGDGSVGSHRFDLDGLMPKLGFGTLNDGRVPLPNPAERPPAEPGRPFLQLVKFTDNTMLYQAGLNSFNHMFLYLYITVNTDLPAWHLPCSIH